LLSAKQKKEIFFEGRKRRGRSCARDPSPFKLVGEKSRTMLEEAGGSNQRRSNEILLFFQRKSRLFSYFTRCALPASIFPNLTSQSEVRKQLHMIEVLKPGAYSRGQNAPANQ
jgi:hypothetical protein